MFHQRNDDEGGKFYNLSPFQALAAKNAEFEANWKLSHGGIKPTRLEMVQRQQQHDFDDKPNFG